MFGNNCHYYSWGYHLVSVYWIVSKHELKLDNKWTNRIQSILVKYLISNVDLKLFILGELGDFAATVSLIVFLFCVLIIVGILTYLWVTCDNDSPLTNEESEHFYYELQQMLETNENIAEYEGEHRLPSLQQQNRMLILHKRKNNSI